MLTKNCILEFEKQFGTRLLTLRRVYNNNAIRRLVAGAQLSDDDDSSSSDGYEYSDSDIEVHEEEEVKKATKRKAPDNSFFDEERKRKLIHMLNMGTHQRFPTELVRRFIHTLFALKIDNQWKQHIIKDIINSEAKGSKMTLYKHANRNNIQFCKNDKDVQLENVEDIPGDVYYKTPNEYCHDINDLLTYLIINKNANKDPVNLTETIWNNTHEKKNMLSHPGIRRDVKMKYDQMLIKNALDKKRYMILLAEKKEVFQQIGSTGFVCVNDEQIAGYNSDAKFETSQKALQSLYDVVSRQDDVSEWKNLSVGSMTLGNILDDAGHTCTHGTGYKLSYLFAVWQDKLYKETGKLVESPLFFRIPNCAYTFSFQTVSVRSFESMPRRGSAWVNSLEYQITAYKIDPRDKTYIEYGRTDMILSKYRGLTGHGPCRTKLHERKTELWEAFTDALYGVIDHYKQFILNGGAKRKRDSDDEEDERSSQRARTLECDDVHAMNYEVAFQGESWSDYLKMYDKPAFIQCIENQFTQQPSVINEPLPELWSHQDRKPSHERTGMVWFADGTSEFEGDVPELCVLGGSYKQYNYHYSNKDQEFKLLFIPTWRDEFIRGMGRQQKLGEYRQSSALDDTYKLLESLLAFYLDLKGYDGWIARVKYDNRYYDEEQAVEDGITLEGAAPEYAVTSDAFRRMIPYIEVTENECFT